jgi:hypothetical protein
MDLRPTPPSSRPGRLARTVPARLRLPYARAPGPEDGPRSLRGVTGVSLRVHPARSNPLELVSRAVHTRDGANGFSVATLLTLQATVGNRTVQRALKEGGLIRGAAPASFGAIQRCGSVHPSQCGCHAMGSEPGAGHGRIATLQRQEGPGRRPLPRIPQCGVLTTGYRGDPSEAIRSAHDAAIWIADHLLSELDRIPLRTIRRHLGPGTSRTAVRRRIQAILDRLGQNSPESLYRCSSGQACAGHGANTSGLTACPASNPPTQICPAFFRSGTTVQSRATLLIHESAHAVGACSDVAVGFNSAQAFQNFAQDVVGRPAVAESDF